MTAKITRPDGTVIALEGTSQEIREALAFPEVFQIHIPSCWHPTPYYPWFVTSGNTIETGPEITWESGTGIASAGFTYTS